MLFPFPRERPRVSSHSASHDSQFHCCAYRSRRRHHSLSLRRTQGKPTLPPADSAEKGYHLQDGKPVTPQLLKASRELSCPCHHQRVLLHFGRCFPTQLFRALIVTSLRTYSQVQMSMIGRMREAIEELPDLPNGCGWDNEPACSFGCKMGELCIPPGATFTLGVAGA